MPNMLWRDPAPLVLASTSATRRDLLASAGLSCETWAPAIDERALEGAFARDLAEDPAQVALALARAKALDVSARLPRSLVIGADQVLACGSERFHKPGSRDEAFAQISRLGGRTHHLHDGVVIVRGGEVLAEFAESAAMTMRPLTPGQINLYLDIAGDAVAGSVGGYRLEGAGIHLFERVEGAHATILGLPLLPLLAALRSLGALRL